MAKVKAKKVTEAQHGPDALVVLRYLAVHENNLRAIHFFEDRGIEWKDA